LTLEGTNKADVLHGSDGDDVIHGNKGNDTIHASSGDDALFGDAGNDLFILGDAAGDTSIDGGKGGNWTDVIEIDFDGGPGGSTSDGGWLLEIEGQQIVDGSQHGSIEGEDMSGKVTTQDSTTEFDNIDKIDW
jgi:Ca2+-binding RTX toxin-like protein